MPTFDVTPIKFLYKQQSMQFYILVNIHIDKELMLNPLKMVLLSMQHNEIKIYFTCLIFLSDKKAFGQVNYDQIQEYLHSYYPKPIHHHNQSILIHDLGHNKFQYNRLCLLFPGAIKHLDSISFGFLCRSLLPCPSLPKSPSPQEKTSPVSVKAKLCPSEPIEPLPFFIYFKKADHPSALCVSRGSFVTAVNQQNKQQVQVDPPSSINHLHHQIRFSSSLNFTHGNGTRRKCYSKWNQIIMPCYMRNWNYAKCDIKFLLVPVVCELSGSESNTSIGTRIAVKFRNIVLRFIEGNNTPSIRAVKGLIDSVVSELGEWTLGGIVLRHKQRVVWREFCRTSSSYQSSRSQI
ncbi:hypothetical protein AGLY_005140 [Aphis glycines]|uniref:Uncharacterized protein n=1 Tax=Aphis glycines TaxID=307491 RepID=A0A6G0TVW5_APHGL|nr:hypothetical protein AGLY_005140 [Aphis glycines]